VVRGDRSDKNTAVAKALMTARGHHREGESLDEIYDMPWQGNWDVETRLQILERSGILTPDYFFIFIYFVGETCFDENHWP